MEGIQEMILAVAGRLVHPETSTSKESTITWENPSHVVFSAFTVTVQPAAEIPVCMPQHIHMLLLFTLQEKNKLQQDKP